MQVATRSISTSTIQEQRATNGALRYLCQLRDGIRQVGHDAEGNNADRGESKIVLADKKASKTTMGAGRRNIL